MNFTAELEEELVGILDHEDTDIKRSKSWQFLSFIECPKHGKPYEAFCENDCKMIWIDCILEDGYQNKNITSIKKAIIAQNDKLNEAVKRADTYEYKLMETKDKVNKYLKSLHKFKKDSLNVIGNTYDEVIQKILKHKMQHVDKINDMFQTESDKCIQKLEEIEKKNQEIEKLKALAFQESKSDDIDRLHDAKINDELIEKWSRVISSFSKPISLRVVQKAALLSEVSSIFHQNVRTPIVSRKDANLRLSR